MFLLCSKLIGRVFMGRATALWRSASSSKQTNPDFNLKRNAPLFLTAR